jgi:hypothetical protein
MHPLASAVLTILAIHAYFWPGNVFFPLARLVHSMPNFLKKPFFKCLFCMSSIWSVPTFFLYCDHGGIIGTTTLLMFLQFLFPLSGILFLVDVLLGYISPSYGQEEE